MMEEENIMNQTDDYIPENNDHIEEIVVHNSQIKLEDRGIAV